jgi:rubredoxin
MISTTKKMECVICGFVYDEESGLPEEGIPPGTAWEDLPAGWLCPECAVGKQGFQELDL